MHYQQFQFVPMNILSAEEMKEVEETLLKVAPRPNYAIIIPQEEDLHSIDSFTSALFPPASSTAQQAVNQMVTLTDRLRSSPTSDPNATFRMLFYSLISILYRDKYRPGGEKQPQSVHYLLQTIKCSLFSPDIDFTCIKGTNFPIETVQLKAMVARFLSLMQEQSLKLTVNRIKCAEWICQHNPLLVQTFILLFRFILSRLEIQQAMNYNQMGNIEESIVNLIEFLDLSYRNFGQMFLFYEQGIFLALTETEIVVGDYFENENEKKTEQKQMQIKQSVKMNLIQSLLVNVNEKAPPKADTNKSGIVASDVKLLNFMLDNSSDQEGEKGVVAKEKEYDNETPCFNQGSQDLFHFGKKKKDSEIKPENIKQEFKRLILDQSDSSSQPEHQGNDAPTPFLGGQSPQFARFQGPKPESPELVNLDSPIDQLNSVTAISMEHKEGLNMVQHPSVRKTAEHLNFFSEVDFTPQSAKVGSGIFKGFGEADAQFYQQNSEQMNQLAQIACCSCRPIRFRRNVLSSHVVNVSFEPNARPTRSFLNKGNSPTKHARKVSSEVNFPVENNKKYPEQASPKNPQRADHKPAFLKTLKKGKDKNEVNKFSQSTVGDGNNMADSPTNKVKGENKLLQKTSAILTHQTPDTPKQMNKQSPLTNWKETNSYRMGAFNQTLKNKTQDRPAPGTAGWQTSSNFHHRVPTYMPKNVNNGTSNPTSNLQTTRNGNAEPYKFYAPVQIIAPTVYFNSPKHASNNNVVVKVNDYNERIHPKSPQVRPNKGETPLEQMKTSSNIHSCSNMQPFNHS